MKLIGNRFEINFQIEEFLLLCTSFAISSSQRAACPYGDM